MIKYTEAEITFREVPDEISLSINISNCPYKCKGCHTPYLQKNIGNELTTEVLDKLIDENKNEITCITFLGDGNNINEMAKLINHCKNKNLLTCLYTGSTDIDNIVNICGKGLCYIKIGQYIQEKGGLDAANTNQKFYKINYCTDTNGKEYVIYNDLTYKFISTVQ